MHVVWCEYENQSVITMFYVISISTTCNKRMINIPWQQICYIFPCSRGRGLVFLFLLLLNWYLYISPKAIHHPAENKPVNQYYNCLGGKLRQDQLQKIKWTNKLHS